MPTTLLARNDVAPVLWFTGRPAAGKSTLARGVLKGLNAAGFSAEHLDGDEVRQIFGGDLGFSREDRCRQALRVSEMARLLTKHRVIVLASLVSPYHDLRQRVRQQHAKFIEIYVDAPIQICRSRDVRGVYSRYDKASKSRPADFDDSYEIPECPEVHCRTATGIVCENVDLILEYLYSSTVLEGYQSS